MSKLGVVEDTLFVPMLGRIYASEYCPQILYDSKGAGTEKETAFQPAGAGRTEPVYSAGLRRPVRQYGSVHPAFLERRPDGVIVQLGCGLERSITAATMEGRTGMPWICPMWWSTGESCCRSRSGRPISPETPLPRTDQQIRTDAPDAPILVTAGGLFHYFEESKVVGLLRMLTGFGEIEIVFDSVSKSGMAMMRKST